MKIEQAAKRMAVSMAEDCEEDAGLKFSRAIDNPPRMRARFIQWINVRSLAIYIKGFSSCANPTGSGGGLIHTQAYTTYLWLWKKGLRGWSRRWWWWV